MYEAAIPEFEKELLLTGVTPDVVAGFRAAYKASGWNASRRLIKSMTLKQPDVVSMA